MGTLVLPFGCISLIFFLRSDQSAVSGSILATGFVLPGSLLSGAQLTAGNRLNASTADGGASGDVERRIAIADASLPRLFPDSR